MQGILHPRKQIGPLTPEQGGIAGPVFSSRAVSRTIRKSAGTSSTSVSALVDISRARAPLFQKAPHHDWLMQTVMVETAEYA
jgi:hypothetical protein